MSKNVNSKEFEDQFNKIITEFRKKNFKVTQEALEEVARDTSKVLQKRTPSNTGITKKSWKVETKYANAKYIGNTHMARNGMPMTNIMEYAHGRRNAFMFRTLESLKYQMLRSFISKMRQKLN